MKKLLITIIILIMLTGCSSTNKPFSLPEDPATPYLFECENTYVTKKSEHVKIEIWENTVSPTGLYIGAFNDTLKVIDGGEIDFRLHRRENDKWVAVNPNRRRHNLHNRAQVIEQNVYWTIDAFWNNPNLDRPYYGVLPHGEYRITFIFPLFGYNISTFYCAYEYFTISYETQQLYSDARKHGAERFCGLSIELVYFDIENEISLIIHNENPIYNYEIWNITLQYHDGDDWRLNQRAIFGWFTVDFMTDGWEVRTDGLSLSQSIEFNANWSWMYRHGHLAPGLHRLIADIVLDVEWGYIQYNRIYPQDRRTILYIEFEVH